MFLGDSLTDYAAGYGYPAYIKDYMTMFTTVGSQIHNNTPNEPRVYSEGHAGKRTDELIAGLDAWMDTERYLLNPPTDALVMAGTNNVLQSYATSVTVADLVTIQSMIKTRFPECKIYIGQILPLGASYASLASAVTELNDAIIAAVTSGDLERTVDTDIGFNTATMLLADDVHTNQTGAALVAQNWANGIA